MKILRLTLILVMVLALSLQATVHRYSWGDEGSGYTGTTTASYVSAVSINTGRFDKVTIVIENTGASNTMYFKVLVYAGSGGSLDYTYISETSIATQTADIIEFTQPVMGKIDIQVKNNSGATTYSVEYIGRK